MERLSSKVKECDKKTTQDGNKCKSKADTMKIQDHILLQQATEDRDKGAILQLITIYYTNIKRYIASRIDAIEDVEDLTQRVFLEFCRKKDGSYREYRSAEAYLLKIAQNLIALYYRNQNRQIKTVPIDSVDELSISEKDPRYEMAKEKLSSQRHKIVQALVNQLPHKAQEAVKLRFLEDLSPKDAAKKSGCSTNTFYQRTLAAIRAIRKLKNESSLAKHKKCPLEKTK